MKLIGWIAGWLSTQSEAVEEDRGRLWGMLARLAAGGCLFLVLVQFPTLPLSWDHDLSSHASFEWYTAHDYQYGVQVYQNVGPYGFVHYGSTYSGILHGWKVALGCLTRIGLAVLIIAFLRALPHWLARLWWLLSFFLFIPLLSPLLLWYAYLGEVPPYVTLYLIAIYSLRLGQDRDFKVGSALAMGLLAFLALTKHTSFLFAFFLMGACLLQGVLNGRWRTAVGLGLGFGGWLLFFWGAAGQDLRSFPQFIKGIFIFSQGYNEAFALRESNFTFVMGLGIMLGLLAGAARRWWQAGWRKETGRFLAEGALLFLLWKHAFVRADMCHLSVFFLGAFFLALPILFGSYDLACITSPARESSSIRRHRLDLAACLGLNAAVVGCAVAGYFSCLRDANHSPSFSPSLLVRHLGENLGWIRDFRGKTQSMETLVNEQRRIVALPMSQQLIARASVDFLGWSPGIPLLNDLNYTPRPMPISFAACNPSLQQANEAFFRSSSTAPAFVLVDLHTIDSRVPGSDDALALRALWDNYCPVAFERGLLIMRRNDAALFQTAAPRLSAKKQEHVLGFDEILELPRSADLVWIEIEVKLNLLGRLVSFFYKPPLCFLDYQLYDKDTRKHYRLVPAMGLNGFLLNPRLETVTDLPIIYQKEIPASYSVKNLSIKCRNQDRSYFDPRIKIRYFPIHRPMFSVSPGEPDQRG